MKSKFDEHGKAIQQHLNGTLIPKVLSSNAFEEQRKSAEEQRIATEQ